MEALCHFPAVRTISFGPRRGWRDTKCQSAQSPLSFPFQVLHRKGARLQGEWELENGSNESAAAAEMIWFPSNEALK